MRKFIFLYLLVLFCCSCEKTEEIAYFCEGHNDTIYVYNNDTVYVNRTDSIYINTTDTVFVNNNDQYYYRYSILQDSYYFTDTISINDPNIYTLQNEYRHKIEEYNSALGTWITTGLWRYDWYVFSSLHFVNEFNEEVIQDEADYYDLYSLVRKMQTKDMPVFGPVSKGFNTKIYMTADLIYGDYFVSNYGNYYPEGVAKSNVIPDKMFLIKLEVSKNHEPFVLAKEAYGEINYCIE